MSAGGEVVERRTFIQALTTMLVVRAVGHDLWAQEQPQPLPPGIGVEPDYDGPLPPLGVLGRAEPPYSQRKIADDILAAAPLGPTPFDVASYFLRVGNGDYSQDWKPYIRGWPVKWNPVIVSFLRSTNSELDHGDETAWCAAFVNWCYQRSSNRVATHSAGSGSFRCFGTEIKHPRKGDIVVFKKPGEDNPCKGKGHVGFFVKDLGDKIQVLGGNQVFGGHHHMICAEDIDKKGRLIFHSYRTDAQLHRSG
jgi:uncharacterized protein (TIGR02594 family)